MACYFIIVLRWEVRDSHLDIMTMGLFVIFLTATYIVCPRNDLRCDNFREVIVESVTECRMVLLAK